MVFTRRPAGPTTPRSAAPSPACSRRRVSTRSAPPGPCPGTAKRRHPGGNRVDVRLAQGQHARHHRPDRLWLRHHRQLERSHHRRNLFTGQVAATYTATGTLELQTAAGDVALNVAANSAATVTTAAQINGGVFGTVSSLNLPVTLNTGSLVSTFAQHVRLQPQSARGKRHHRHHDGRSGGRRSG